jgi:hypothetical protein
VQPFFALLTLPAVSVLVAPGPEEGCPSARQVSDALSERAPAAQSTRALDSESALTLVLPPSGTPQEPSFSLVDQQGRLRLFRTLARPGTAHARDCAALSVTVAIIVQRYLEEIELPEVEAARKSPPIQLATPAPAPAAPPVVAGPPLRARARWDISLGVSQRFADQIAALEAYDLRVSVARTLGARMDSGLLLRLWSGISGWTPYGWTGGRGDVIRVPSGLELMWRRAAAFGVELQLGLAGLLDCWILGARYQTNAHWDYRFVAAGALTGGMQVALGKRLFARLFFDVAVAGWRYRYYDRTANGQTVFSTPGVFGDAGLAFGMSLR